MKARYLIATALLAATVAVGTAARAGDFVASPQDYPNATAYAQAYSGAFADLKSGKLTGVCFGPTAYNGIACRYVMTPIQRRVVLDNGGQDASRPSIGDK